MSAAFARIARSAPLFACFALCALYLPAGPTTSALAQQTNGSLTQRRINALAAALQKAHRALIEDPGLRRPGEPFEAYFARVAAPLPGETPTQYQKRIEGYLSALDLAAQASAGFRTVPALKDTRPENQRCWQNTARPLSSLPGRMVKTRIVWQLHPGLSHPQAAGNAHLPTRRPDPQDSSRLGAELALTLRLINSASEALRDARP